MSKDFNLIKNNTTPWPCFKDPYSRLIYFVHLKCASVLHTRLFLKLGWKECTTADVDWNQDIVFSYIRDPLAKHRIGVLEWFTPDNMNDILVTNQFNSNFFVMLSKIAYLDTHSLSIYEHLGDNSMLVNWIPIDCPTIDHKQKTIELIEKSSVIHSSIKDWFLSEPPVHVSTGFKKECFNKLMSLPVDPLIIKSIEYDRQLYDRAISTPPHVRAGESYQLRITQLLDQGLSQTQAEYIADQEVINDEYLKWNFNA